MLWLALHLAHLPLEVLTRGAASGAAPTVITQASGQRQTIVMADAAALGHGIAPGMMLSAAYVLAPNLRALPRNTVAEQDALEQLASWAGQFTSLASLAPPDALLLEIGASLKLFRGVRPLRARVLKKLKQLGYSAHPAIAPTPLAALWCARAQHNTCVTDIAQLAGALAPLPVHCLGLEPRQMHLLHALGVTTCGALTRLPRAGLARRLGAELVTLLDRALGKHPDPRPPWNAPPRYESHIAFPGGVEHVEALLFALKRLLHELAGQLGARAMGVQRLTLHLRHNRAAATEVELGLAAPSRNARHLLDLFRERLQRVELPEPVETLTLRATGWIPLAGHAPDLFAARSGTDTHAAELIERLQARLGRNAVHGLASVAEHRPEHAWRPRDLAERLQGVYVKQRPLWLLPEPVPLHEHDGRPIGIHGPLRLETERERIESGWWDEHAVARDYFIAHAVDGAVLWIYRELGEPRRWMVHGVFA